MTFNLYRQEFKNIEISDVSTFERQNVEKAIKRLRNEIAEKKIPALSIVEQNDDLQNFQKITQSLQKFKKIFVLGVGGSSLGAKTICAIKSNCQLEFIESIDPDSIANSLNNVDFATSFFLVISKSGQTVETICQALIVIDKFRKENHSQQILAENFLFITADKLSSLAQIANKINAQVIDHPADIGGRYSVFCAVGVIPALIAGLDVKKFRSGAKLAIDYFLNNSTIANSIAIQIELYNRGFRNNVFMPYVDILKNFTDWYRQLLAESLGKNGYGATPINSMGTVDQHSQLQLYLEGNHDKFFTFISAKIKTNDFTINDLEGCKTLFANKKLSEILDIEKNTTIEVLRQKKLPIRLFELNKVDEESLGALMMQMFLEIIAIAYAKNINPFDQPAVELRKDLAKQILANFYE